MLDLAIALGIWGAIIILCSVIGKLLRRPLVEGTVFGIFIAMLALAILLHPFDVVDGVYHPQYGDSIVGIIIPVSLILTGIGLVYILIKMGRCHCCCFKNSEQFDKITHWDDLYSDNVV